MADLRMKVFTLVGMATACAGMAFGQATLAAVNPVTAPTTFIRAEGTTELLPTSTVNLTGSVAGTISITVYLSPQLTITSETYKNGAGTTVSEITATPNGGAAVNGVVSGSTITFSGIVTAAAGGTTSVAIANIRVNATALAASAGVPTGAAEQVFLGGPNATPGVTTPVTVAYALNGLGTVAVPASGNAGAAVSNLICAAVSNATLQFTLNVAEGFANSFKTLAGESGTNAGAPATNGTRLAVTFANVPGTGTNVSLYVPLSVATSTAGGAGVLTLITSPTATTAAANAAAAAGTSAPLTTYGAVTVANGTGTAYYEVTTAPAAGVIETYPINVYESAKTGVLTAPATAMTASVSFAPISATPIANWPSFVIGSSTGTPVTGSTFAACTTTLLFPFVTNQAGFETGIAIANAGSDLLGLTKGVPSSSVTGQTGTCTFTFFGGTTNPAAFTTAATGVVPGTDWTGTLTSVTGGTPGTFGGYMIAQCNFLYAHGFSYITYNIGNASAMAMGYLALPLGTPRVVPSTLFPESLGN